LILGTPSLLATQSDTETPNALIVDAARPHPREHGRLALHGTKPGIERIWELSAISDC